MNKKVISILALAVVLIFGAESLMAADGVLTDLHPPGNYGQMHGVGKITTKDGKRYQFKTPGDVATPLLVGFPVSFDIVGRKMVSNVKGKGFLGDYSRGIGQICACNPTEGLYAFCPSEQSCATCCNKISERRE